MRQWGVNSVPKVVAQQPHGWGSNPRPLDRKSDGLPLSHCATLSRDAGRGKMRGAVVDLLAVRHRRRCSAYSLCLIRRTDLYSPVIGRKNTTNVKH